MKSELERIHLLPILLMSPLLTIQSKNETVSTGGKSGRKISQRAHSHNFLFVCSSTSTFNSYNLSGFANTPNLAYFTPQLLRVSITIVYTVMRGLRARNSENGFFHCDTQLQIFLNDSKICKAEVTVTPLINKICKP